MKHAWNFKNSYIWTYENKFHRWQWWKLHGKMCNAWNVNVSFTSKSEFPMNFIEHISWIRKLVVSVNPSVPSSVSWHQTKQRPTWFMKSRSRSTSIYFKFNSSILHSRSWIKLSLDFQGQFASTSHFENLNYISCDHWLTVKTLGNSLNRTRSLVQEDSIDELEHRHH